MNAAKIIGSNIRRFREQKGIKQEMLAKHMGITKGRLSQIENGACEELSICRIEKMALYLEVSFFMLVAPDSKTSYINNIENYSSGANDGNHIPAELISALADELAKRMLHS